jgi:hypothetical protein
MQTAKLLQKNEKGKLVASTKHGRTTGMPSIHPRQHSHGEMTKVVNMCHCESCDPQGKAHTHHIIYFHVFPISFFIQTERKKHWWKKGLQSRFVKPINPGCRNRN